MLNLKLTPIQSTDGTYPGLDLFTGNSHFWGSYPTVFLTEYVLGVRPTKPAYEEYLFAPLSGFKTEWVHGRVPTPSGVIKAAWGYDSQGKMSMEIHAPRGLHGTLVPPFEGAYSAGDRQGLTGNFSIFGGKRFIIVQE